MATYGVTPQGFVRKTLENIIGELEEDQLAEIADDLDVSTDSIVGQQNGVVGRQLSIGWEQLEIVYHSNDPDYAEGRGLEAVGKLTGTFRVGNTESEVLLVCNLDNGTTLTAGTHFAAIEDKPDIRWTPMADFTAPSTGSHTIAFKSELKGKIEGFAGTINIIATPVVGWNSVLNPDDAELGDEVDADPEFRTRREKELATIGSSTIRAMYANVLQAFRSKLQNLTVFENDGDNTNDDGLPPHSIEVLIFDGDVPSVDNAALAAVIDESKAGGVQSTGNTTVTINKVVNGITSVVPVRFSRASQLPIYLIIDLVKKPGAPYVGDQAIKESVALQGNAYFGPGDEIVEDRIRTFVMANAGVHDIDQIRLGLVASPGATVNIPVALREIGRFSTSRIIVNAS